MDLISEFLLFKWLVEPTDSVIIEVALTGEFARWKSGCTETLAGVELLDIRTTPGFSDRVAGADNRHGEDAQDKNHDDPHS